MLKGAFINLSKKNDGIELFIFMQVPNQYVIDAFPDKQYDEIKDHDTLYSIFYDGINCLGSDTFQNIVKLTNSSDKLMINLFTNKYSDIIKNLPYLQYSVYVSLYNFAASLLDLPTIKEEEYKPPFTISSVIKK